MSAFFDKYFAYIILSGVIVMGGYITVLEFQASGLRKDKALQSAQIASLTTQNATFKAYVDWQNDALAKRVHDDALRAAAADAAAMRAAQESATEQARVDAIIAAPDAGTDCENANRLFIKFMNPSQP